MTDPITLTYSLKETSGITGCEEEDCRELSKETAGRIKPANSFKKSRVSNYNYVSSRIVRTKLLDTYEADMTANRAK